MADIVVGIGTSHGPMLNTPPAEWGGRAVADRRNPALAFRGRDHTYDELRALRTPGFADECAAEVWAARHTACRAAIDGLGAAVRAARPDVLVIFSSDHKEVFDDELLPPFAVYWGDSVQHEPLTREALDAMPPGLAIAEVANVPEVSTVRSCHPELALKIIAETGAAGFDPGASRRLPAGKHGDHGIPHGWGFVHQQVLGGQGDMPFVPVFVNTFWEPNPPTAARCYDFGVAVGDAVRSFGPDLRVGMVASGGLSHFVVDEDLDRAFLSALERGDTTALRALDSAELRSGTSELRNWVAVAGAVAGSGLTAHTLDYQPCYRSEAGTGNAMGFVVWE